MKGLLSIALNHPISQPNSLDLSQIAHALQKGEGRALWPLKGVVFVVAEQPKEEG
jgi:hypothetical protein